LLAALIDAFEPTRVEQHVLERGQLSSAALETSR
jgi:hypothetical protein